MAVTDAAKWHLGVLIGGNDFRMYVIPRDEQLVDAIVAWGDEAAVARRVQEHRDAGADHVCVQVLSPEFTGLPLDEWRRLAPALVG